jgi:hypothetical protein
VVLDCRRRPARRCASVGVAILIGALAVVACSSDDSSNTSSTPPTTGTTSSTPATKPPCGGIAAVDVAVRQSPIAGLGDATSKYDVIGVRAAKSDPTWARFKDVPRAGVTDFQGGYGVVHCDANGWTVYDVGTSDVGCGGGAIPAVPGPVRADLDLQCSSGP